MEKWFKYLRKLRKVEQLRLLETIELIMNDQVGRLDVKKLKGHRNVYRVRAGRYRIIYATDKTKNYIVKVDEKDDRTYDL